MITIKLGELKEIIEGLNEILEKELPVKPAYWFGKLAKMIKKEMSDFEDARLNLVKKYAIKDENGNFIIEDNRYKLTDNTAFETEFMELISTEIDIDFIPVSIDQLGDVKVSPVVMIGLDKFIEF